MYVIGKLGEIGDCCGIFVEDEWDDHPRIGV